MQLWMPRWARAFAYFSRIDAGVLAILKQQRRTNVALADLIKEVEDQRTIIDSLHTLIHGMAAHFQAAIDSVKAQPAADQVDLSELQTLSDALAANHAALVSAVGDAQTIDAAVNPAPGIPVDTQAADTTQQATLDPTQATG